MFIVAGTPTAPRISDVVRCVGEDTAKVHEKSLTPFLVPAAQSARGCVFVGSSRGAVISYSIPTCPSSSLATNAFDSQEDLTEHTPEKSPIVHAPLRGADLSCLEF